MATFYEHYELVHSSFAETIKMKTAANMLPMYDTPAIASVMTTTTVAQIRHNGPALGRGEVYITSQSMLITRIQEYKIFICIFVCTVTRNT